MASIQTFLTRSLAEARSRRFVLGVVVSGICLYLVFRGVAIAELAYALRSAGYVWLLPTAVLLILGLWLRAVRWRVLFVPVRELSLSRLFDAVNIGYLASNLLPARAGDLIRAGLISTTEPVSASRALATVLIERVLDVLTVVLLLTLLLPVLPIPPELVRAGQAAGFGAIGVAAALILLSTQRARGVRWTAALLERVPRIDAERWAERVGGLIDGLAVLRSPWALGQAVLWSLLLWLTTAGAFYLVMQAFHLGLPPTAAVFVLCATALGVILPATPGYLGVFDYVVVLALALFNVERSLALSYALVLHGVMYVVVSGVGVVSLMRYSRR